MDTHGYWLLMAVTLLTTLRGRSEASYSKIKEKFEVQPLSEEDTNKEEGDTDFLLSLNNGFDESVLCQFPHDCEDIRDCGRPKSGVYRVFPFGTGSGFLVYCDMDTSGGAWLVFQRRQDGSVNFQRDWKAYSDGFGNLVGEFWLGLDKLHLLTSQRRYELVVNLMKYDKGYRYAAYDRFYISDKIENYRLLLGQYSGSAGNGLDVHNGCMFSTPDNDNDYSSSENCAATRSAAWWFNACDNSNLNGVYQHVDKKIQSPMTSVNWFHWEKNDRPMQLTEMKIRPSKSSFPRLRDGDFR